MRILVTGAAGFIGSHLSHRLVERGDEVLGFDNLNSYYDPALDNQNARHPTWYANYNRNYYTTNSHWQLDGSFVKLRNAQLGYSMPSSVTDRIGTQRMRVYVTAKNLWMHHNLGIDLDPEYSRPIPDVYPQTRVFSIGTDIAF